MSIINMRSILLRNGEGKSRQNPSCPREFSVLLLGTEGTCAWEINVLLLGIEVILFQ
jgi:hypothetical protein